MPSYVSSYFGCLRHGFGQEIRFRQDTVLSGHALVMTQSCQETAFSQDGLKGLATEKRKHGKKASKTALLERATLWSGHGLVKTQLNCHETPTILSEGGIVSRRSCWDATSGAPSGMRLRAHSIAAICFFLLCFMRFALRARVLVLGGGDMIVACSEGGWCKRPLWARRGYATP